MSSSHALGVLSGLMALITLICRKRRLGRPTFQALMTTALTMLLSLLSSFLAIFAAMMCWYVLKDPTKFFANEPWYKQFFSFWDWSLDFTSYFKSFEGETHDALRRQQDAYSIKAPLPPNRPNDDDYLKTWNQYCLFLIDRNRVSNIQSWKSHRCRIWVSIIDNTQIHFIIIAVINALTIALNLKTMAQSVNVF